MPDSEEVDGNKENEPVEPIQDMEINNGQLTASVDNFRIEKETGDADFSLSDASPAKVKVDSSRSGGKKPKKRGRKASRAVKMKYSKMSGNELLGLSVDPKEAPGSLNQVKDIEKRGILDLKKTSRRRVEANHNVSATMSTPQHVTGSLPDTDIPNQSDKTSTIELGASLDAAQNKGYGSAKAVAGLTQDDKKSGSCKDSTNTTRKRKSAAKSNFSKLSRCKKLKGSATFLPKVDSKKGVQEDISDASAKLIECNKTQSNHDGRATEILSTSDNSKHADQAVLYKCAFCLSSEESEVILNS